jgi:hypothetical protein
MSDGKLPFEVDQITLYARGPWSIVYLKYHHLPATWDNPTFVDLMYEDENITLMAKMGGHETFQSDHPPIPDEVYEKYNFWKGMLTS